jgi:hypothetical protein
MTFAKRVNHLAPEGAHHVLAVPRLWKPRGGKSSTWRSGSQTCPLSKT